MHRFHYRNDTLYAEDVPVGEAARRFGTPLYLYSHGTIVDHYLKIKEAFREVEPLICFSMKANSSSAVLASLVKRGAGLDIVSGGELYRSRRVKCPASRIVYASVGKREDEIDEAIRAGILLFNVESEPELRMINRRAHARRKKVMVTLRLNPDVEAHTHHYITTGKSENKFGLDFNTARAIIRFSNRYKNVDIAGVHIHIGSQITEAQPFVAAIRKTLRFIDTLGVVIRYFNIGGGMGIVYDKERPQGANEFAAKVLPLFEDRDFKLILEPGRFIVGNSGILVTRVVYIKKSASGKHFAIVDAGMNDLIRPSLYSAYHEILPVDCPRQAGGARSRRTVKYDVVGPICESGDFLGKDRVLPELKEGDLLAVMGAGAYGYAMSSNYNSRPRLPEVMVIKNRVHLVRPRETYADLVRGEKVPKGI
ncbi:MAG: diaminopimelate decarboxylase [Candidatus Omnitrophica bacterium]|nr:diaminopimelate decarboxylase [Candidatus Omnitrophota bacterium]